MPNHVPYCREHEKGRRWFLADQRSVTRTRNKDLIWPHSNNPSCWNKTTNHDLETSLIRGAKKFQVCKSAGETMTYVFWDADGIIRKKNHYLLRRPNKKEGNGQTASWGTIPPRQHSSSQKRNFNGCHSRNEIQAVLFVRHNSRWLLFPWLDSEVIAAVEAFLEGQDKYFFLRESWV